MSRGWWNEPGAPWSYLRSLAQRPQKNVVVGTLTTNDYGIGKAGVGSNL